MSVPYQLKFKSGKILELGGGDIPLCDAQGNRVTFNMDIRENKNVDLVHQIEDIPWPFEDKSWDNCFAKYVLEHVSWRDIEKVVGEIFRILKPNGKFIAFIPNTLEQAKRIVNEGINRGTIELLFGSQEFTPSYIGTHKTGFDEKYIRQLFKDAGFGVIKIYSHPVSGTDMVLEAYKILRNELFERSYFDGEIGYGGTGYRDFATHYATSRILMKDEPESLIDIGGGRGYVVKLLENEGVKAAVMDISKHCMMTRVTDSFILHDATVIPWPSANVTASNMVNDMPDKYWDICFSINFFEHIPKEHLDDVIRESIRVSKRGIHGIHMTDCPYEERDPDIDITHEIRESSSWWLNKFKTINPDYNMKIAHPRDLEYEKPEQQPPITLMPIPTDQRIKLNLGSFTDMFYYGWKNIDIINLNEFAKKQSYEFTQQDIRKNIPYKDNEVDIIFSSHLIEHITREEGKKLLKECYRVLKKGGIIRFSTPDTQFITEKYIKGNIWEYKYINTGVEQATDDAEAYYNLLLAGHKTIYDEKSLKKLFETIGFKNIKRVNPFESRSETIRKETITTHPSISLVIEAEK